MTETPNWDTEDIDEILGSRLSWFDCPILPPGEMLATIKRCGGLDGRSLNLFAALERPPRSDLFNLYLRENLYQPGSHYVYVTPDAVEYGYKDYRPVMTKGVMQLGKIWPCALFSNTLSWGKTPPSERTHNAGFGVYTIDLTICRFLINYGSFGQVSSSGSTRSSGSTEITAAMRPSTRAARASISISYRPSAPKARSDRHGKFVIPGLLDARPAGCVASPLIRDLLVPVGNNLP